MNFIGDPRPYARADVVDAADALGVTEAHVKAVLAVESRGRGFDPTTKRPIILYEPHVFHRETDGKWSSRFGGVSYEDWGHKPYPHTQDGRYGQLIYAMGLDEKAALRATSWGLGQIMGFNHEACGFKTVAQFVDAMVKSERDQLLAFARLLRTWGLGEKLKRGDWAGFARKYNGPGYKTNRYDEKLEAAYKRFAA